MEAARRALGDLKSRGVTRYLDLNKINKRSIDEVESDEEGMDDDGDATGPPAPQRPRLSIPGMTTPPRDGIQDLDDLDTVGTISPVPTTPAMSPAAGVIPIAETEAEDEPMVAPSQESLHVEPEPPAQLEAEPMVLDVPVPQEDVIEENHPEASDQLALPVPAPSEAEPHEELSPTLPQSMRTQHPEVFLDPATAALYENYSQVFAIDDLDGTQLPGGWSLDSEGYMVLTDQVTDFWEVKSGCLIRHHLQPRHGLIEATHYKDIPIDPKFLDPVRITVMRLPDGRLETATDDGKLVHRRPLAWTGATVFQINGPARRELCMVAVLNAKKVGREIKHTMAKQQKKQSKKVVSERDLNVEERALFQAAKAKELQSFFEHEVWTFDVEANADSSRTLTARMLLTWGKHPDGSPRAKARLIVRGYADVDALEGRLETASPTTTRLSRSCLLSLTSILNWDLWTADISTAFLQGLPQERELWVKLPADALRLLGASPDVRMKLRKPCYGQLDAPRRWWLEATRRLTSLGLRQHQFDPCTFLIYESDLEERYGQKVAATSPLADSGLVGMVCLHVDDMLGSGDATSIIYQNVIKALKETFSFREWKDGDALEYCGATISKTSDGLKVNHDKYLKKIHPMTLQKHLQPEQELSQREV